MTQNIAYDDLYRQIQDFEFRIKALELRDQLPIGSVLCYVSETPPPNFLICDGSAVSRKIYSSLFSVIGTRFGIGDGQTSFNLPQFFNSVPIGFWPGDVVGGTASPLGKRYGTTINTASFNVSFHVVNFIILAQ